MRGKFFTVTVLNCEEVLSCLQHKLINDASRVIIARQPLIIQQCLHTCCVTAGALASFVNIAIIMQADVREDGSCSRLNNISGCWVAE